MMSITDYNKDILVRFTNNDGKDAPYVKLEDLFGENGKEEVYKVNALFINDTKFGKQPLAVIDGYNVNLPKHLLDVVYEITQNNKIREDINNGIVGFKIYSYVSEKYGTVNYSVEWVEFMSK